MNYEEKYKEALDKLKKGLAPVDGKEIKGVTKSFLEEVFPELRESEDERVREGLIKGFQHYDKECKWGEFTTTEILSWLEKQGEHAKFRESIQVGDKVTRNEAGDLVNLSQLERIAKPSQCENKHYVEVCGDNRFEIIEKAKKDIISSTNIETRPEEMSVLDSFLFRCWQMGWLERYEEQKSSWSEEDEKRLIIAINLIRNTRIITDEYDKEIQEKTINWLKSLKSKKHWKPSEKQMEALKKRTYGLHTSSETRKTLESLINDLKNL